MTGNQANGKADVKIAPGHRKSSQQQCRAPCSYRGPKHPVLTLRDYRVLLKPRPRWLANTTAFLETLSNPGSGTAHPGLHRMVTKTSEMLRDLASQPCFGQHPPGQTQGKGEALGGPLAKLRPEDGTVGGQAHLWPQPPTLPG